MKENKIEIKSVIFTCGTTLASAYVLRHLSAAWLQLQMKERSLSGSEC